MLNLTAAGNVGNDAELRTVGKDAVCSFSIAVNKKVGDVKSTTWVRCSLWGPYGERMAQYLTKGTFVVASGEMATREHDGKTYIEMRGDKVTLGGGGQASHGEQRQQAPQPQRTQPRAPQPHDVAYDSFPPLAQDRPPPQRRAPAPPPEDEDPYL